MIREASELSVLDLIPNFIGIDGWGGKTHENENQFKNESSLKGLFMFSNGVDSADVNWGTMALSTNSSGKVTYRTSWAKLGWNWTFREFVDDFTKDGDLKTYLQKYTDNKLSKDAKISFLNYDWALNEK